MGLLKTEIKNKIGSVNTLINNLKKAKTEIDAQTDINELKKALHYSVDAQIKMNEQLLLIMQKV